MKTALTVTLEIYDELLGALWPKLVLVPSDNTHRDHYQNIQHPHVALKVANARIS